MPRRVRKNCACVLKRLPKSTHLQYLHRVLRRLDPEAAVRIGSRDRPKMIRAIEVCLLTGRPLSGNPSSGTLSPRRV